MLTTEDTVVSYSGQFLDDKRSGRVDELTVGPNKELLFRGRMNRQEQIHDKGTLEIDTAYVTALMGVADSEMIKYKRNQGKVSYMGGFEENKFSGKGTLEYEDGSRFESEFVNNQKQGPAKFILPDGHCYAGVYANNIADPKLDEFGPRF